MSAVQGRNPAFDRSAIVEETGERIFYEIGGRHLEKLEVLAEIFHRILTPLYGPQDKAIDQIRESKDRKCFLLYENNAPVGVLVFKTVLSNEFEEFNVSGSIEIKSLFVDQSNRNSGRGIGSALVDKVKAEALNLGLGHKSIHVTVSETKQESLMFFQKKGFQIAHEWRGRYIPGVTEYLLSCPSRIEDIEASRLRRIESARMPASSSTDVPELVHVIHDAHLGDIHALRRLADGTFISGSKDNCLYKWDRLGNCVRVVDEIEPNYQAEQDWVTAIAVINPEYWVSGERNGRISLWKTNGDYVKDIELKRPRFGSHISHEYNARRVNCLAAGLRLGTPSFFAGFPTMFDEFNFIEGRTETSTTVHKNDWVYSIYPLDGKRVLTVTGCTVDLWQKNEALWICEDTVVPEAKRIQVDRKKSQRVFISALEPLQSDPNFFSISCFDGSVKVIDIQTKRPINIWKEHQDKAWCLANVSGLIASGSEDRSIKLWDLRMDRSVRTIEDHVGRLTALLNLEENILLAGTCPENPVSSNKGAQIRFYDIRK